jgi:lysozyme
MSFPANGIPGIDISHYQGVVDWAALKASSGEQFVYAKATEGTSIVDPYFHDNWAGIKSAGLFRGAYHFFHPDQDAFAQAAFFIERLTIANGSILHCPGDLPAALDLETTGGCSPDVILSGVTKWLEMVGLATGRRPLLYTYTSFWRDTLHNPTELSNYPLWIAQYSAAVPAKIGGWPDYTIWQYGQTPVAGISVKTDVNSFNGTSDQLRHLAGFILG